MSRTQIDCYRIAQRIFGVDAGIFWVILSYMDDNIQGTCWYLGWFTVGIYLSILGRVDIFSCYNDGITQRNTNIYNSCARIGVFGGVVFKTFFGGICHLN